MNLKDYVVVSGLPGIFIMAANRSNGLIVEEIDTGKKKFASARSHQFTPLESIAIFTEDDDATELVDIFKAMRDKSADTPIVKPSASAKELRAYFTEILPNHDRDRVNISDIKKVVKWYNFLNERNLLIDTEEKSEEEE